MKTTPDVEEHTAPDSLVSGRTSPHRVDLPSGPAIETIRFYFHGHYAGCVTAVVDEDSVRLTLIGWKGGHRGRATASRRALEREALATKDRNRR